MNLLGIPIAEDPDLGPDVFWLIDTESRVPLGIGLVPSRASTDPSHPDGTLPS